VVALMEWRGRRRRETGGVGGLLRWASVACWWYDIAAGAAEAVGEKPLERVLPLN